MVKISGSYSDNIPVIVGDLLFTNDDFPDIKFSGETLIIF